MDKVSNNLPTIIIPNKLLLIYIRATVFVDQKYCVSSPPPLSFFCGDIVFMLSIQPNITKVYSLTPVTL